MLLLIKKTLDEVNTWLLRQIRLHQKKLYSRMGKQTEWEIALSDHWGEKPYINAVHLNHFQ